jgi:broad specificity phosphatase PhoE
MLFLITHAHTQQKRDADATGWDLSPAGYEQAAALARLPLWGGVDRVVLSSEPKTRLTVDLRYDELGRGSGWVDDYSARVAEVFANPERSIGGWEAANDALTRFREGIHALADAFPHETIALVGHGLTFTLFRAHLLGQAQVNFDDWQRLSFCALAEVEWPGLTLAQDFQPIPGAPPIERG